ncbi:FMN-binding negative transcriptional regulator [Uliginosibacterium sp. sgz301328]|uniref:FMN-binding negative transcriptional regulator n=1 Tax=Uliginosibacterium sp. sgz301328 TaxID=3243764 RepID=UPI00359D1452
MYLPRHFEAPDLQQIHQLIEDHPLGALVTLGPDGLDANHIPFLLDRNDGPHDRLIAHVARANSVWRNACDGAEVLVIFRGEDAYISPNWYPSKQEMHRQVPTWNYRVAHVHGKLTVRDDERFVRGVVARLMRKHEAAVNGERAWKMGDAPADYIDGLLAHIIGLEIAITRIEAKWKLGQNRDGRDRASAAQALEDRGERAIASAMREKKD